MCMIQCIGGFVAILFFIYIYYRRHNGGEIMPNWPIVGMLLSVLRHLSNFNDHFTLVLKCHGGTFRFEGP
ncbi:hypothetical protein MtrunA17_Chr1g0183601 [Medicago truncatula]|uniref:Transmembrane protein n=1 Tax=Medicago truncatula TaxID=3880 RepID=A0A396JUU4_MEDTR|nr:hypothetical protein MtrunA17_Chr1g0183601 [Medicago truncatula]